MDGGKIKHSVLKILENCGVVLPNETSLKEPWSH
jgi:hypothetical protein